MRGKGGERKRFLVYCLYAFGGPAVLTLSVYLIDHISSIPKYFKPLMGISRCWIQDNRMVEAIFIYLPISIILVVNIVLYSVTAFKIYKVQKETSVIRNGESQKHSKIDADKDRWGFLTWVVRVLNSNFEVAGRNIFVGSSCIFDYSLLWELHGGKINFWFCTLIMNLKKIF